MNIREQLLLEHSKANAELIANYIGNDSKRLKELMNCFFSNEYRVSQRAAHVVSFCFDKYPKSMKPYMFRLINNLEREDLHVAVRRNTVRILQEIKIPENQLTFLFDKCMAYLVDSKETIAVKAFSMGILGNICKSYPELKQEVIPQIEACAIQTDTAGIRSRSKRILKQLHAL